MIVLKNKVLIPAMLLVAALALTGCTPGDENGTNPSPSSSVSPNQTQGPVESGSPQTTTVPGNGDAATTFTPGTYTGTGKGMNGDVQVSVSFTDTAITQVQVISHAETEGIYERAIDEIPRQIVSGQTLDVDAVSGATWTSNAILEGVEDCVNQAGGDPQALKQGATTPGGTNPDMLDPNSTGSPSGTPNGATAVPDNTGNGTGDGTGGSSGTGGGTGTGGTGTGGTSTGGTGSGTGSGTGTGTGTGTGMGN